MSTYTYCTYLIKNLFDNQFTMRKVHLLDWIGLDWTALGKMSKSKTSFKTKKSDKYLRYFLKESLLSENERRKDGRKDYQICYTTLQQDSYCVQP